MKGKKPVNPVITSDQAKQITGGRTPLVPVEYEAAVKALQACSTLDEAKYWGNKADALAAWAKIYRNDQAGIEAKRLKLHAYRRMGELAAELRPRTMRTGTEWHLKRGANPGPKSLLVEQGLTKSQAESAVGVYRRTKAEFEAIVSSPRPPSPIVLLRNGANTYYGEIRAALMQARSLMRKRDAVQIARGLTDKEAETARRLIGDLGEWFDAFDQALPKVKK